MSVTCLRFHVPAKITLFPTLRRVSSRFAIVGVHAALRKMMDTDHKLTLCGPLALPAGLPCGAMAAPVSPLKASYAVKWGQLPKFSTTSKPMCASHWHSVGRPPSEANRESRSA